MATVIRKRRCAYNFPRLASAVSGEALEHHFGADGADQDGRVKIFRAHRSTFEQMARTIYLAWPVEDADSVLIKANDVAKLRQEMSVG